MNRIEIALGLFRVSAAGTLAVVGALLIALVFLALLMLAEWPEYATLI